MKNSSNCATHPIRTMKRDWIQSRHLIDNQGLEVFYCIEPPDIYKPPPMTHHFLAFQLSKCTNQITQLNGKEYDGEYYPGEFLLAPAGVSGFSSWETTEEILSFSIAPEFLTKVAIETECINPNKIEVRDLITSYDVQLENIAYYFLKEIKTEGIGGKIYIESLANIFAINLLRNQCVFTVQVKELTGGLSPYHKQQVIDYIKANLTHQIGLPEICQITGLSQYHFIREFKKSVGVTPHRYIMKQRVAKAKKLLNQQPKLSIVNIALDCGFCNQSHLGKVFKQHTGVTPSRYRQKL